jgi:hypothetical protein
VDNGEGVRCIGVEDVKGPSKSLAIAQLKRGFGRADRLKFSEPSLFNLALRIDEAPNTEYNF